jgi:GT2 family glycosyltransferase
MSGKPKISVVIPTRNRPAALRRCLEALAESTLDPRSFEVIVVDDGSDPPLTAAISAMGGKLALSVLRQEHRGPAAARNHGRARAAAPLLAFTDDDCRPSPDWLPAILRSAEEAPAAMVGGTTLNAVHTSIFSEASQLLIRYLYETYLQPSGQPNFFTSNNLAVLAVALEEIGGFNERFPRAAGEDRELCQRWSSAGLPMLFAPDAIVMHDHDLDACGFARQHFNYGRGGYLLRRTCEENKVPVPRFESASFYLRLIGYPYHGSEPARAAQLTLVMVLSQVFNAAGYAFEAMNSLVARICRKSRT